MRFLVGTGFQEILLLTGSICWKKELFCKQTELDLPNAILCSKLMLLWGCQSTVLHVEAEHLRVLAVPQKILTLQLHLYLRFSTDHYNFGANLPAVTICCLLFCVIDHSSCMHWIPSTESPVQDILHPWRDIQTVRPVGLKESPPK